MKKSSYIRLLGSFLILLSLWLTGCEDVPYAKDEREVGRVSLQLNLLAPGPMQTSTRAMDASQESAIDYNQIQILAFESTESGEVFRYSAVISDRTPPTVTLKVPVSKHGEEYRFVILANAPVISIADGTEKSVALNQFIFDCVGKWNTSSANYSKIPMWGELPNPIRITNDRSTSILLHRALARVDVGTRFKFNNANPDTGEVYEYAETDKESVWGLDNFKIKDIRVYRTYHRGYVASSQDKMSGSEVVVPNIPASAAYNSDDGSVYQTLDEADANPLIYSLDVAQDSYIREIYLPESVIIDAQSDMDNVPCLVIGGYYGETNGSEVTYYRADFATYANKKIVSYRPILRNHRYVFDIQKVESPGFETPEQALRSISAPLKLNVVAWNEVPLGYYTQGNYYFGVDNRFISMEARAQGDATTNTYTISYQTNLELNGTTGKSLTYTWRDGVYFDVSIDYTRKTITFTARQDNIGDLSTVREDILTLQVENLQLTIHVNQKAFMLNYLLQCDAVKVNGRYRAGLPLDYSHYITLKVRTIGSNFNGLPYEVQTIKKNGIYFRTKGTFNGLDATSVGGGNYEYTLQLEGYGTLTNDSGTDPIPPFEVQLVTNSVDATTCLARILPGYATKRILAIGANAAYRFGYMLEPNTASRAFMDASMNFGTDPNSTVTMEENESGNAFTIEVMTAGQGMSGEVINYNYLLSKLNTFKPDIILTGQAVNYYTSGSNTNVIDLLADFVNAGGVFLMCNEYYPVASSIEAMVRKIMGTGVSGNNQHIAYNQLFQLNGAEDDLIANGPFGDMRGKQWGSDGHEMHGFTSLPAAETITYSSRSDGYINMFRHATKPFFFMGEGGFISNAQRYLGGTYQGSYVYCPFAIDRNYRPIPRTNYTTSQNVTVYNSQIFGNIIAWAVDYSEMHGISYENDHKFPL